MVFANRRALLTIRIIRESESARVVGRRDINEQMCGIVRPRQIRRDLRHDRIANPLVVIFRHLRIAPVLAEDFVDSGIGVTRIEA